MRIAGRQQPEQRLHLILRKVFGITGFYMGQKFPQSFYGSLRHGKKLGAIADLSERADGSGIFAQGADKLL